MSGWYMSLSWLSEEKINNYRLIENSFEKICKHLVVHNSPMSIHPRLIEERTIEKLKESGVLVVIVEGKDAPNWWGEDCSHHNNQRVYISLQQAPKGTKEELSQTDWWKAEEAKGNLMDVDDQGQVWCRKKTGKIFYEMLGEKYHFKPNTDVVKNLERGVFEQIMELTM